MPKASSVQYSSEKSSTSTAILRRGIPERSSLSQISLSVKSMTLSEWFTRCTMLSGWKSESMVTPTAPDALTARKLTAQRAVFLAQTAILSPLAIPAFANMRPNCVI